MLSLQEYQVYYDDFYGRTDFNHYPEKVSLKFLDAIFSKFGITKGAGILDLGCGTGAQLQVMRKLGMKVTGLDLSIVGLKIAKNRSPHVDLIKGDALRLPVAHGSFDAVISVGCSLMNAEEPEIIQEMFAEALSVIRPAGWVIATTLSTFRGVSIHGWRHRSMNEIISIVNKIHCAKKTVLCTLPRLGKISRRLVLSKAIDFCLRLPGNYSRTIVLGFQS